MSLTREFQNLINIRLKVIREFVDSDDSLDLLSNESDIKEIEDEYTKVTQLYMNTQNYMKDLFYIQFNIVQAKTSIDRSTPSGQQQLKVVSTYLSSTDLLVKALESINNKYFAAQRYYERILRGQL